MQHRGPGCSRASFGCLLRRAMSLVALQDLIDGAFAEIMPTVKQRVLRKADEYLFTPVRQRLRRRRPKPIHLSEQEVSQRLSTMPWYRRARARVLYIMDPHDQTIWRYVGVFSPGPVLGIAMLCCTRRVNDVSLSVSVSASVSVSVSVWILVDACGASRGGRFSSSVSFRGWGHCGGSSFSS